MIFTTLKQLRYDLTNLYFIKTQKTLYDTIYSKPKTKHFNVSLTRRVFTKCLNCMIAAPSFKLVRNNLNIQHVKHLNLSMTLCKCLDPPLVSLNMQRQRNTLKLLRHRVVFYSFTWFCCRETIVLAPLQLTQKNPYSSYPSFCPY